MIAAPEANAAGVAASGSTRGEAREQAILDAALDLIAEVGYDRMSMDGLAARARSSKATIYRRWPGKAQVVVEMMRRRSCPADMEVPDTGSLRGDLLAVMTARRDALTGEDGPLLLGLLLAARADDELAALIHTQLQDDKARVANLIVSRAVARGEVPATADPELIQELAPAVLLMRLVVLRQPTDDAFLTHIVDDVLVPVLAGCPCGGDEPVGAAGTRGTMAGLSHRRTHPARPPEPPIGANK